MVMERVQCRLGLQKGFSFRCIVKVRLRIKFEFFYRVRVSYG